LAGWAPGIPLLDPMCGSGTLLIEAAQMALCIAPGLRRSFAFEKLPGFDVTSWTRIKTQAQSEVKESASLPLYGSDLYGDALKLARQNLEAADLAGVVSLNQANVLEISAPAPEGLLITNPPYGIRVGEQDTLAAFYPQLGNALKKKFAGWRAYVFTADMRLPKLIGLSPSKRTPLYNGPLECRLYEFRLVEGSMRKKSKDFPG
jgi:putative N6-adenine-specific DNA methylase